MFTTVHFLSVFEVDLLLPNTEFTMVLGLAPSPKDISTMALASPARRHLERGGAFVGDSFSGELAGIFGDLLFHPPGVLVYDTYVSGSPLSGTVTYSGQTFASMGLMPGVYDWIWGSGNPDSYRLIIGDSAPPNTVPGPLPIFGVAAALSYSRKLRQRIKSSAFN